MKIKIWGVRGSIPTPYTNSNIQEKIKRALSLVKPDDVLSEESITSFIASLPFSVKNVFGGNTASLEVTTNNNDLIIIDAGTGIRNLGKELMMKEFGKGNGQGAIIFTHTHWDHIQGLPFFIPLYIKGNRFNIYSPIKDIKKRIEHQQVFTHFPINLDYMFADKEFHHLKPEEDFYMNGLKIFPKEMIHPGGSYGLRFEEEGKVFIYTSDCEFNIHRIDTIDLYEDFFKDADVVIFDTQYTFEESVSKINWGHSSASIAIDIVTRFNCKKLILFHHEPDYSDEKLESVLTDAKTYLSMNTAKKSKLEIDIAYEGMEIDL